MSIPKPEQKIWNPAFTSIFIANVLMFLGQQMINVLVPKYAYSLGATPATVGLVASAFAYTALLLKVFSAPAIDTFNKKYVLSLAILVMGAAYVGYSFSASLHSLFLFRLLQGAGQAFSATCCLALASDALPTEKLGTGIGYFSLGQAISQSIGPTIGLFLVGRIGYNMTFAFSAGVMVVAAVAALQVKNNYVCTIPFKISIERIIAKEAILPSILMFFLSMAYYNVTAFLVIYASQRGIQGNIGFFFTVYALTLFFSRPFVGRMSDRYGTVKVLIPAMVSFALAFILISISSTLWMLLVAAFVSAFGYGACQPVIQSLSMKSVPKQRRGAGSTTNYIGQDLGNLVGPVVAGFVIQTVGYQAMWICMLVPVIFAMALVIGSRNRIGVVEEKLLASAKRT